VSSHQPDYSTADGLNYKVYKEINKSCYTECNIALCYTVITVAILLFLFACLSKLNVSMYASKLWLYFIKYGNISTHLKQLETN